MDNENLVMAKVIADKFVEWQDENGGIDTQKCPYLHPEYKPLFRYMEVPFMARALYKTFDETMKISYKEAADKYCKFYLNLTTDLITSRCIAYNLGIAIESACLYAKFNPKNFQGMETNSKLMWKWLHQLRTDLGSHFKCGYNGGLEGCPDVGFSDDLCHVGRGLVRLYEMTWDNRVLEDIKGLAIYFLTDAKDGTMQGVWNSTLGTWLIGPWPHVGFEHLENTPANKAGWGFSAYGVSEFLLDAYIHLDDNKIKKQIAEKTVQSAKWFFDNCQFDDGGMGITGRDDKWMGMAAAAVLYYTKMKKRNILTYEDEIYLKPLALKTWRWLKENSNPISMPLAGYIEVTGKTAPYPGDNVAWLFAWIIESFLTCKELDYFKD